MRNDTSTYQNGSNLVIFASGQDIGTQMGERKVSMVLDTNPTFWTVAWKIHDVSARGATAYSTNPTINYVSFGGTAPQATSTMLRCQC